MYFLLGFMGCGKSYLGSLLAERLDIPFTDLDSTIETGERTSISDLFENAGESGFRQLERRYLWETIKNGPRVVATGGGTPCFFDNMHWMNRQGTTIYLQTPIAVLIARLRAQQSERPLLARIPDDELDEYIKNLLKEREHFYRQAQVLAPYVKDTVLFLENLLLELSLKH